MKSEVIDLSQSSYWQEILDNLEPGLQDIYFSPEYYQLAAENNEGDVRCFIFRDKEKVALYPFLINSMTTSSSNCVCTTRIQLSTTGAADIKQQWNFGSCQSAILPSFPH